MNRRNFFKGIGAVTAVTIVAPHIIMAPVPKIEPIVYNDGLWHQLRRANCVQYDGAITSEQIKEAIDHVFNKPPTERQFVVRGSREFNRQFKTAMYERLG